MTLKIIGAGFGRTGTLSLKQALERLGFGPCYHMTELLHHPEHIPVWSAATAGDAIDWQALFSGYNTSLDWPACNFWREQRSAFPDARVLLTVRDPEKWYESIMSTIYQFSQQAIDSKNPRKRGMALWSQEVVWNKVFDNRMDDRAHVLEIFERHNEAVRREVPKERLLVLDTPGCWEPLCEFLEVEIPPEDYPRSNSTTSFQKEHLSS